MNRLTDSIELRAKRIKAYRAGLYTFSAPPVCTTLWGEEGWCNFVRFADPSLTGFLPYDHVKQSQARCTL